MRDGEAQLSLGSGWTRSGSLNQTSGHRQLSVISYQDLETGETHREPSSVVCCCSGSDYLIIGF